MLKKKYSCLQTTFIFLNDKKCDFYLENEEYQTQAYGLADNRILPEQGIFLGCNAF